ncbi:putative ubiquitinyl hydrolase 1 [Helianthus annuus]|nr:putative ubiquitinyl hydrolase 1 [Helianthus annuus]
MANTTSLAPGWEVYAAFKIFLLDQNNDIYLKLEGNKLFDKLCINGYNIHIHMTLICHPDERTNGRRFHRLRTEWGFDQFMSLKEFGDSNNGYLLEDNCVFGAEVFVRKERSKGKTESLSLVKDAVSYKHTWRISNYSKVNADCENSNVFNVGDHKWKLQLYPNGKGGIGGYISLKLALAEPEKLPSGTKILAEFTLRMLDQLDTRHYYGKGKCIHHSREHWLFNWACNFGCKYSFATEMTVFCKALLLRSQKCMCKSKFATALQQANVLRLLFATTISVLYLMTTFSNPFSNASQMILSDWFATLRCRFVP